MIHEARQATHTQRTPLPSRMANDDLRQNTRVPTDNVRQSFQNKRNIHKCTEVNFKLTYFTHGILHIMWSK